jgi:cephalosporin hydroxylase
MRKGDDAALSLAPEQYHRWYYDQRVWQTTTFLGVPCLKSVLDLWNYQEILYQRRPSLVIEFGTFHGGSALYFAEVLRHARPRSRVLSVDIDHGKVAGVVRAHDRVELLECDSTSPLVTGRVDALRAEYPGSAFFVLDSDHRKEHVRGELLQLRSITLAGDYVVVEDGNINGHPVLPDWGEGPHEALQEYLERFPDDYVGDTDRERKFGFTFAPGGFLIRR